jgi:hypothetical protein
MKRISWKALEFSSAGKERENQNLYNNKMFSQCFICSQQKVEEYYPEFD